jgi:hypothetical protein
MTALQDAINAAIEWKAKAAGNDWAVFEPIPGENDQDRAIRECAKLLALRIDRGAPAEMIDCQAHRLADLINPPAPPAFSYQDTSSRPSVAAQVLTGAAVGLAVAAVGRSGIGRTIVHQAVRSAVHVGFRELVR